MRLSASVRACQGGFGNFVRFARSSHRREARGLRGILRCIQWGKCLHHGNSKLHRNAPRMPSLRMRLVLSIEHEGTSWMRRTIAAGAQHMSVEQPIWRQHSCCDVDPAKGNILYVALKCPTPHRGRASDSVICSGRFAKRIRS